MGDLKEKRMSSFLKKIQTNWTIVAEDGPNSSKTVPSGASNPENWVTQLQTGKSSFELKEDATKLRDIVGSWQSSALEAHDVFKTLMANGGRGFEQNSPILLKGLSREKLLFIAEICSKMAEQAPSV